jgi:hypothetical protein
VSVQSERAEAAALDLLKLRMRKLIEPAQVLSVQESSQRLAIVVLGLPETRRRVGEPNASVCGIHAFRVMMTAAGGWRTMRSRLARAIRGAIAD